VKDIRAELRKYGNENPQSKYREELKLREIQMTNNMKKGMLGMIDSMAQQKRSGPRYVDH
jgi:import inner membrane translocase subunit TIM50